MTATPTQAPPTATREPPPRRNRLILGVAAVLLIVVAGAVGWWIGSSSDDTVNVAEELPEIISEFYDAVVDGDSTSLRAVFTEDGGLTGPTEDQTRSNLTFPTAAQSMSLWFQYVDYADVEHLDVITDANTVVVVATLSGMSSTHQRSSETPFSATVVDVFEFRDGLIAQWDAYFEYGEVVT